MHRTILPSALVLILVTAGGGLDAEAKKPARQSELVELGRRLFMDPAVSRNGLFSCASCHDPEHGFSDARIFSEDENGKTRRHSQTLIDLVDDVGMHWDGEFDRVRELLVARLGTAVAAVAQANALHERHFKLASGRGHTPDTREYKRKLQVVTPPYYGPEMNRRRAAPRAVPVSLRLQADGRYDRAFHRAFGTRAVTTERVIDAVEAYVLSIRSTASPFDRFYRGNKAAISDAAKRGFELFRGKANCASCHSGEEVDGRAAFTDNIYRNTGVAFKDVRMDFRDGFTADGGLGHMSFVEQDLGKFKTPTLRDVAARAPYMHDGSLKTLEEVVRYYDRGGTSNAGLHAAVKPLRLTDQEVADLVAFLKTLTSDERPALGRPQVHRPSRTRVRIVDVYGKPLRGRRVTVTPFGDRLKGAAVRGAPMELKTTTGGWIQFKFPLWTHVTLETTGFEIGEDRPLPDCAGTTTLVATHRSMISLRVIAPKGQVMPGRIEATTTTASGQQVTATFRRVRQLASGDALYVAAASKLFGPKRKIFGRHTVRLDFTPRRGRNFLRRIDFSGGATETLNLRSE